MTNTNCDKLRGRLRDLCRGHDDAGNPASTPEKLAKWQRYFHGGEYEQAERANGLTREQREANRLAQSRECWRRLHQYAIDHAHCWDATIAQAWLAAWEETIPKYGCGGTCRKKWNAIKTRLPPAFTSADEFHQWTIDAHNAVNIDLGKPMFMPE